MDNNEQKVTEVRETNDRVGNTNVQRQSVSTAAAAPRNVVARRVVWFIAGFIMVVLALRFLFLLLGANQGNGFVDFIYNLGGFFAAPFDGIFSFAPSYGRSFFDINSLVAIALYGLIAWGIAKLLTLKNPNT